MGPGSLFRPDSDDVFEAKLLRAMKEDGRVDFNVRNLPSVCEKCSIEIDYWEYMTKSSPNGKHWSYHIDRMIKKGFLRAKKYKGGNPVEFSVVSGELKPKKIERKSPEYKGKLSNLFMEQLFHILLYTNLEIVSVECIPAYCKYNNVSLNYWATIKGNKGLLKQYLKCMESKNMIQIVETDKYKLPTKIRINRERESVIHHIEDKKEKINQEINEKSGPQNHRNPKNNDSTSSYDNVFFANNNIYYGKNDDDDVFINNDTVRNKESTIPPVTPSYSVDQILKNNNVFASISSLGLLEDYNFETELEPFDERPFVTRYMQSISSDYNSLYNNSSSVDLITPLDFKCNLFTCMDKGIFYTIESLQDSYKCYYGSTLTTSLVNEIFNTKCPSLDIAIYTNINSIMLKKSETGIVSICRY
uniref:Fork-head domain-containing protein n=1 Tax=Strongyloides papillosus TaxID=174720 RepID=A0A0N5BM98_STREA